MSIMNMVIKIFRIPSRLDIVAQPLQTPVERNLDPVFQRHIWDSRNPTPHQDEVARLRAITWVNRRAL